MKQLKALGLVAFGALALAACDDKSRTTENTGATDHPTTVVDDHAKKVDTTATEKKADLDKRIDNDDKLGTPSGKGGGPTMAGSREWGRDKVAQARCAHYSTCSDIAKGKKYDTMDSCLTREKADLDKDWSMDKCTKMDSQRLDSCLAAFKDKKCGEIFNTSPSECAESKVCLEK